MTTTEPFWKVFVDYAIRLVFPLLLAGSGWIFKTTLDHNARLIQLEATTYTKSEASQDFKELTLEFKNLHLEIEGVSRKIDTQQPPAWLLDRISNIEKQLERIAKKVP